MKRCRHVWIEGHDGFHRGEVCVYCGAWRDLPPNTSSGAE